MRKTKFRGLNSNGNWSYGNLVSMHALGGRWTTGIQALAGDAEEPYRPFGSVNVNPETVGEFTGLHDKNGREIYEGDIVEAWSQGVRATGEIKQRIDGLWLMYPAWQKGISWSLAPDQYDGSTTVEVIGNRWEHPHLLNKGEKA